MIKVKSLNYSYGNVNILNDISFTINESEVVGVIGPGGSGKSTLLRCLANLLKPESGSVQNEFILNNSFCDKISLVIQEPEQQFFLDNVYDEVGFALKGLVSDEELEKKVLESLRFVGFEGEINQSPFRLSGGQQRRVALASILVMNPGILLLDEPTVGLDASGLMILRRLAKHYKQQGGIMIIASYDLDFLYSVVDRFLLFSDGKLIADFKTEEFNRYQNILMEMGLEIPELVKITARDIPQSILLKIRDIE
ncbi:MAG TPA: ATP-binding cassette domain-containing protein [Bacillota bacterium]|nr:ATP-binding cassette domain-containing protein [Bacillota bacterium]HOL08994.1 ATP-binding cassette domain-containing protein [Bacillota bacterium]HPO96452.1 ATP-binding cassette domain-containing protein [Bacillota bacterium]